MGGKQDERREFLEVGDELWDMRQLEREIAATKDLAEDPERVRDSFSWGRLTVRRMVHFAQPPGEELGWELWVQHGAGERPIYFGAESTHDIGRIKAELAANKDEIARRMTELTQEQTQNQLSSQEKRNVIGHGL